MFSVRGLPAVGKTEILIKGGPDILRRLAAECPEMKFGEPGVSGDPAFDLSVYVYSHSLELERNLQTALRRLLNAPPAPAVAAREKKTPAWMAAAAAVVLLAVVGSAGWWLFGPKQARQTAFDESSDEIQDETPAKGATARTTADPGRTTRGEPRRTNANQASIDAAWDNLANVSVEDIPGEPSAGLAASGKPFTMNMIDVAQGDALLLAFPSGKNMLIDAGENKGRENLMATLKQLRVGRIDYLVVTHPHLDHMAGLKQVMAEYKIGQVIEPGFPHTTGTYTRFLEDVKRLKIPYQKAVEGQKIDVGRNITCKVLSPPKTFLSNTRSDANNSSVVLHIKHGKNGFLFTGDIEAEIEDRLVKSASSDLRATVLKAPHHGGAHSSQAHFLNAVRPKYVLISCGAGNSYGHPAPGSMVRYQKAGAAVYRTDKDGTITVISDGNSIRVQTQNNSSGNKVLARR